MISPGPRHGGAGASVFHGGAGAGFEPEVELVLNVAECCCVAPLTRVAPGGFKPNFGATADRVLKPSFDANGSFITGPGFDVADCFC